MDLGKELRELCTQLLEAAMHQGRATRGNVQLVDSAAGGLLIVSHSGFDEEFLQYFSLVTDDGTACGRAAKRVSQVLIDDVRLDESFAPHRAIARSSGFLGVQSTPLIGTSGALVGMVSTHYAEPHLPPTEALATLTEIGRAYGSVISGLLENPVKRPVDVLVVEDQEAMRSSLAMILTEAGFEVAEASDGVDALELLETTSARTMIVDVKMPRLDGIGLMKRMPSPPPTIIMSANDHRGEIDSLGSKVFSSVRKPFAPLDIIALVTRALEESRRPPVGR